MNELTNHMKAVCRLLSITAPIAIIAGFPTVWVSILSFLVLDVSAVAWATKDIPPRPTRSCEASCIKHQEIVARAAA